MEREEHNEEKKKRVRETHLRPVRAGWFKREGLYQPSESYIPCPKITFLIDKPRNLMCQICYESRLDLRTDRIWLADRTPAILPCGHVAGLRCLKHWFSHLASEGKAPCCPFCRVKLEYPECGHTVPERPITRENVHLLPATLQGGGEISNRFWECSRPGLRVVAAELMQARKAAFLEARERALTTGLEEDELILVQRKREFEAAVTERLHVNEVTSRAARW
jgi:hypothetical protein